MKDYQWYNELKQSKLNPPNYLFSIVWPILYILISISAFIIFLKTKFNSFGLFIFIIQLIINLSWSNIFFKQKKIELALLMLGLIIFLTFITFYEFLKINKISAYLLIPYLCWLCFACYLNMYIVFQN